MSTEEERSYSDAMNEWAAKQSVFQNTRSRLIHPDPSLPFLFRVFGYLVRLAIVLLILYGLSYFVVGRYLAGGGFSSMMGEKIGERLHASEVDHNPYSWRGKRARTRIFSATGSDKAFYKSLYATSVRFEMPRSKLFSKSWHLDEILVETLEVELKVGSSSDPTAVAARYRLPLTTAGLGINPDLNRLTFDSLSIARADFSWGVSDTNKGSLSGAPMTLRPEESGYALEISGGELSQNWWRGVAVESLTLGVGGGKIGFRDGALKFPSGGAGLLRGEIELGDVPKVNLKMGMKGTNIEGLIHPDFRRYLSGNIDGVINIGGSPNTQAGISSEGTVRLSGGRLRNIATFEAISMLLESSGFRQFPLTTGSVEFSTGASVLDVKSFEFVSDGGPQGQSILRGAFRVTLKEDEIEEDVPPLELPADGLPEEEGTENKKQVAESARWMIKGTIQLGIPEATLAAGHPSAGEFFQADGAGKAWIELPLSGTIDELSQDLRNTAIERTRKDLD